MSRYDLFRKRLAPIAFVLAIGLMVRESCQKEQRTHTKVELQFAGEQARVKEVNVSVLSAGETLATFHRTAMPGTQIGPCVFPSALPTDEGELRIDVDLGDRHQHITRRIHPIEGSTTIVPIPDDDLPAAPAAPAATPPSVAPAPAPASN